MPPFLAYADEGPHSPLAPLVLVHGHPFDHTLWTPQLDAFSATRRVIAPDLRGYGASPVVPGVTPLSVFADDLADLLDELGVGSFVLAGVSMGGQIAMECSARFPERIRGLVLADTFAGAETPEGVEGRHATADRLLREGMRGYADEVLYKMVAPHAAPETAAHVHRMMTATDPEGAAAALRGRAARPDYHEVLARLSVPALVVVGDADAYTPLSDAEDLHATLPDSELEVIEGTGHLPHLERPGRFNEVLRAWLGARIDVG
jgi:3-oxoadipate enol-lactonase